MQFRPQSNCVSAELLEAGTSEGAMKGWEKKHHGMHPFAEAFADKEQGMPKHSSLRPTRTDSVVKHVDIGQVFGTERGTSRDQVAAIQNHVKNGGKLPMIEVGKVRGEPGFHVIDGNHRLDALTALHPSGKIPVKVRMTSFEE